AAFRHVWVGPWAATNRKPRTPKAAFASRPLRAEAGRWARRSAKNNTGRVAHRRHHRAIAVARPILRVLVQPAEASAHGRRDRRHRRARADAPRGLIEQPV